MSTTVRRLNPPTIHQPQRWVCASLDPTYKLRTRQNSGAGEREATAPLS
jgi:hypothetical protein